MAGDIENLRKLAVLDDEIYEKEEEARRKPSALAEEERYAVDLEAESARLAEENRALQTDKETARRQAAETSSQLEQARQTVTRLTTEAAARTEQSATAATGPGASTDLTQLRAELARIQVVAKAQGHTVSSWLRFIAERQAHNGGK